MSNCNYAEVTLEPPVEVEFDGRKTIRYRYTVTDPNDPEHPEKFFTASKSDSVQIDTHLAEGKTILKVDRIGAGKNTLYIIRPA